MSPKPRICGWGLCLSAVLLVAGAVILSVEPPCVFRSAFGLLCPGCGMSRAVRALLDFDVLGAVAYNPNLFLLPVLCALLLTGGAVPRWGKTVRRILIGLGGLFLAVNVIRPFLWHFGMLPWL